MKKRASSVLALLGGHVFNRFLDNVRTRMLVKHSKGFHKDALGNFIHGRDLNTGKEAIVQGGRSALVPDSRILELEAREYRPTFDSICRQNGWDPYNLTKRQLVTLRRTLRGDFSKAKGIRKGENTKLVADMVSTMGQQEPISSEVVQKVLKDPKALKELEDAWQKNPYLGNLGRGISKQINSKNLIELADKNRKLQNLPRKKGLIVSTGVRSAAESYGDTALGIIDPTAPVTNAATRWFNSKSAKKFVDQDLSELPNTNPKKVMQGGVKLVKKVLEKNPRKSAITNGQNGRAYVPRIIPKTIANNPVVDNAVNKVRIYTTDLPTAATNQFNNKVYRLAHDIDHRY